MTRISRKAILWTIIIATSSLLSAAVVLFSYQKAYADKIYRNIYFTDINLSGKTKKQAEFIIRNDFQDIVDKDVTLKAGDKEVKVKLSDTGLTFDVDKITDETYAIGRGKKFIDNLFRSSKTIFNKTVVSATPYIDQDKYNQFLQIAVGQLENDPKDATVVIENGEIKTTPSTDGIKIKTDNLIDQIIAASDQNDTPTIELDTTITKASVNDVDFENAKNQASAFLASKITFNYADKKYQPSRTDIGYWVTFQSVAGQYTAKLDDSPIKAYLNTISKKFEVTKIDRKVDSVSGAILDPGRQGIYLDKDKTLADLKSKIAAGGAIAIAMTVTTQDPVEIKVDPNSNLQLGRFEGKYIDVDLTNQRLCRVEGQTLIDCNIVSTGKPSTPTPTGTFTIFYKNPKSWSTSAGLWMPWYEEFAAGGYGIHELPEWPNGFKEGADHLGIPVSHGCIRLGIGPAETLYNWTEIGTQMYIHK